MQDDAFAVSRASRRPTPGPIGRRVVVTGMGGAGKSTFSRELSATTGLPVIHLDLHFWQPGWTEPSEAQWREKQHDLAAADEWILDGNYHGTLDLRLERADTAVFLDTYWCVCAWRALVRGMRKRPEDSELPYGCTEPALRRLRDEWRLAWRIWRDHRSQRELELQVLARHSNRVSVHVLNSKRAIHEFLGGCARSAG